MPQLIGFLLILALVIFVVAVVVWIVQWIIAGVVWVVQALLLPLLIFLLPALLGLGVLAGLYWGSWIAAKNYLEAVRKNVQPAGGLETLVRASVLSLQTATLAALCIASTALSLFLVVTVVEAGVGYVQGYYAAIEFPIFEIVFPFWEA